MRGSARCAWCWRCWRAGAMAQPADCRNASRGGTIAATGDRSGGAARRAVRRKGQGDHRGPDGRRPRPSAASRRRRPTCWAANRATCCAARRRQRKPGDNGYVLHAGLRARHVPGARMVPTCSLRCHAREPYHDPYPDCPDCAARIGRLLQLLPDAGAAAHDGRCAARVGGDLHERRGAALLRIAARSDRGRPDNGLYSDPDNSSLWPTVSLPVDHRPAANPPWMKQSDRGGEKALPLPLREGVGGRGAYGLGRCRVRAPPPTPSLKGRGRLLFLASEAKPLRDRMNARGRLLRLRSQ